MFESWFVIPGPASASLALESGIGLLAFRDRLTRAAMALALHAACGVRVCSPANAVGCRVARGHGM